MDNFVTNPGAGGVTFASDEIAGVHYSRIKLVIGADGANDGDVSLANPMPVTGAVTVAGVATAAKQDTSNAALGAPADAEAAGDGSIIALLKRLRTLLAGTLTVAGTVTANLGTIAGAATDAMVQAVRDRLPAAFTGGGGVKVGLVDALPAGANVIGQVTANAGTNLNTSLLALEAGGNLATIAGKDFATQATLSTLNGKIPADPAREGGNLATLTAKDFATQTTLSSIDGKLTSGIVVAVSALPSGAATAAKQDTQTTRLDSILAELGQKTEPADMQLIAGVVTVSSSALPAGAATEVTLAALAAVDFLTETTFAERVPVNGQALMADSIPVVVALDQDSIGERYTRRQIEKGVLEDAESGQMVYVRRGCERITVPDRRGRFERGNVR